MTCNVEGANVSIYADANLGLINTVLGVAAFAGRLINPAHTLFSSQPMSILTQTGMVAVSYQNGSGNAEIANTGISINGPTAALFSKIGTGAILATQVFTGAAVGFFSFPTAVAIGFFAIGVLAAARSNTTVNDIITDPDFYSNLRDGNAEAYLANTYNITLPDIGRMLLDAGMSGQIQNEPPGVDSCNEKPVDAGVNTGFHTASRTRPPAPRDPLAIDLDGDGIETVGSAVNPVLFDHNADGIRAGTGWVRPDDAWLVLDRDGNGLIDSGRELFGVDTVLSGTPGVDAVYASTGFQALAALDGNFDNVFDASDAAFTQVRLWRDLNQDGISQSTELFTLAQYNIASISLNASTTNINLGNGNTVSGTAVVTRVNGSTTQAGSVNVASDTTAANLNLTSNPFYREFTTPVAPSTAAIALPEMGGSGWVRDLREVMSLGTPQGNALAAQVQAFAAATTRDAQMALLDNVLRLWAQTNQVQAMGPADDPNRRFLLQRDAANEAVWRAAA